MLYCKIGTKLNLLVSCMLLAFWSLSSFFLIPFFLHTCSHNTLKHSKLGHGTRGTNFWYILLYTCIPARIQVYTKSKHNPMQTHLSWFMYQYSNVYNNYHRIQRLWHLQSVWLSLHNVRHTEEGCRDSRKLCKCQSLRILWQWLKTFEYWQLNIFKYQYIM